MGLSAKASASRAVVSTLALGLPLGSIILSSGVALAEAPPDESAIIRRVLEIARSSSKPATKPMVTTPQTPPVGSLSRLADQLSKTSSPKRLAQLADEFARAVGSTRRRDIVDIYDAIRRIRKNAAAVTAFESAYEVAQEGSIDRRLLVLQIIGEMRQPNSLQFLRGVAWKPLPPKQEGAELTSRREYEEMIEAAAVEAIAYIRDAKDDPSEQAVSETLAVAAGHESHAVRLAAIDAYVWNYGDDAAHLGELRRRLPPDSQRYVEMPRFHRGASGAKFAKDVLDWRQKWVPEEGDLK